MEKITLFILSIGLGSFGCDSQSPLSTIKSDSQREVSAIVVYEGDPAVDGCGWLIQHGQNIFSPVNLDSDFKTDSLKVMLIYKVLDSTWDCGWRMPGYKQIEVLEMRRQ